MRITDVLAIEHRLFSTMFDAIEEALPAVKTAAELHLMGQLIERMLGAHARAEEDIILSALDHVLEEKSQQARFHQEHEELDSRFQELQKIADPAKARAALKGAISASRKHFKHEEKIVFPMAEKVMQAETLIKLGKALLEHPPKPAK